MPLKRLRAPILSILSLGLAHCTRGPAPCQPVAPEQEASVAPRVSALGDELRDLYHRRAYHACLAHGAAAELPLNPRSRAWQVACASAAGRLGWAADEVRAMAREFAGEPWSRWAQIVHNLARPVHQLDQAEATAELFELATHDRDFAWLRMFALFRSAGSASAEVGGQLDELAGRFDFPEHQLIAVRSLQMNPRADRDASKADRDAHYSQALARLDQRFPDAVDITYHRALDAAARGEAKQSAALGARAWQASPTSASLHRLRWRSAWQAGRERAELWTLVDESLAKWPGRADLLGLAVDFARELGAESQAQAYAGALVSRFPTSEAAYRLAFAEVEALGAGVRGLAGGRHTDPGASQYFAALSSFSQREPAPLPDLRAKALTRLFRYISQHADEERAPMPSPQARLRLAEDLVAWVDFNPPLTHVELPIFLAESTPHLDDALRLVAATDREIARLDRIIRAGLGPSGYRRRTAQLQAMALDAQGWVRWLAGQGESAKQLLQRAHAMLPTRAETLAHLAEVAFAEGRYEEAESWLAQGYEVTRAGHSPCDRVADKLFAVAGSKEADVGAYVARLVADGRVRRKTQILAEQRPVGAVLENFRRRDLDGEPFDLENSAAKVLVLHFWGTWCGPCVEEIPAYQQLVEDYGPRNDVELLTVAVGDEAAELRRFMAREGLKFRVLLDDGLAEQLSAGELPTTLFLDRDRNIRFITDRPSQRLREEFTWRIAALLGEKEG